MLKNDSLRDSLETGRLLLVPFTADSLSLFNRDLPAFEKKYGVVYQGEELDYLLRGFLQKLEREIAEDPENYLFFTEFLIVLKEDGRVVGSIDFKYPPRDGVTEVGYGLNPAHEGHGYMTEALGAMLAFAKARGVKTVRADTLKDNIKSQNVLRRCGFEFLREDGNLWWEINLEENAMQKENLIVRLEKKEERGEVENLVRESFWNVYRPGCLEHFVIHVLRDDPAFVRELDLVMEKDGRIIGQNMFMKTRIDADDGRQIEVLTMGPICITPELKRKGYGKILLDRSLELAAGLGFGAVLFEGNILFYGKSGFDYARKFGIRYHDLPEGEDDSFFLCRELIPGYLDGVTGVYQTPAGYYVDEAACEKFDKSFPPKEKLKLPGQLF